LLELGSPDDEGAG